MDSSNTGYWLMNPIRHEEYLTLKRAEFDSFDHVRDCFSIASLIAQECLSFNGKKVRITNRGKEAIEFFKKS